MTLWGNKNWLILGLAFFTFACEDPGEIGLELNPDNGAFVAKYSEITIPSFIIQYEDILSVNSTRIDSYRLPNQPQQRSGDGRILVGSYSSDFGRFQSEGYTNVYLGLSNFDPTGFVFDSLVFNIKVDYLYGQQADTPLKLSVHELTEEIKLDSLYMTKNTTSYDPDPIGEFVIDMSGFDSTRVDTVYRTRLSDEVGQRLFDKALDDPNVYDNNMEFREFFKGLALVSDESNNALAGIHAESQFTYIRMYIHDTEGESVFDYILQGYDTLGFEITRYYNHTTLDKSGTALQGIDGYYKDYETSNGLTYFQAASGIMTKLNLSPYINFLDTVKNLVINKAEMVIAVEDYTNMEVPAPSFDLYNTDASNRFIEQFDSTQLKVFYKTVGRLNYVKYPNENKGEFTGDITDYIQQIASGESSDTLLLVGQASLWNSILYVNQSVTAKDKIYLNIYYSSLQQ